MEGIELTIHKARPTRDGGEEWDIVKKTVAGNRLVRYKRDSERRGRKV